ncbi:chromosome segregation protein SMC [Candidatus Woesearchaeota archaeon]|nr:chromosome segregation protein SMC [Candidatus Woesearchaeota archaeon]
MTQINKLVMQGFKSFAKRTEMPFPGNFTLVIGPNGAGKSNVLDSLCFVLGRLSSKDLRTEKLAHLIYNGGKTKQPAAKGEVSIFFDNKGKTFPTEESAVKLSRIVKPNGQSVYKINDKASRRQEIVDLMALAKINPDGYNIVLQGDINHFVEMSSEERRQTVEDIAGIGVYEEKKKKALGELERVEARVREAEILLAERKTHLRELKKDRDQAMQYRDLSNKIKQDKATYIHLQINSKSGRKSGLDKDIAAHKEEIEKIKSAIEKLKLSAGEKKREVEEITAEVEEKGEAEQIAMHRAIEQTRVDIATSNNRISMINSEIEKASARREQLAADSERLEKKIGDITEESLDLEKNKAAIAEEKMRLDKEAKKLRGSDYGDVAQVEEKLVKLDKEAEKLQQEIQSIVERKQQLIREKDKIEFQISSTEASIKKIEELQKSHKAELNSLENRRKEFKKTTLELNKLLGEDSTISAQIGAIKKRLYQANEEQTKLRMQYLASRERAFGSNAVKQILEQEQIKGIHGTVAQLGTVPDKYAAALEAAAGARINSIVVDTDAVAARCIKYLKAKKAGRATFLPLNKMKQDSGQPSVKESGVHGAAVELVKFDPRYKNVFSYVFGNTLVVDSVETARNIGIGKYRMATLDGDLTELSGAMRGGYRQKTANPFESLGKSVESADRNIAELENSLSVHERTKNENEERISRLRELKAALEGEIIKAEKSLHLDSTEADAGQKNKAQLASELKGVESELEALDPKIAGYNKKIAELKTEKLKMREQISGLGNPAVVAELSALDQKISELNDQIISMNGQLNANKAQSEEVLSQEKIRISQIIKQITREADEFRQEKERLLKSANSKKMQLAEMESKASKFQAKNKSLFEKRTKIIEAIQQDEEKTIRKEEQINTIEVKINNITIKASEIAGELAGLQEEFSPYSDIKLLENAGEEQLKADISKFERMVAQMGNVNLKALEIYEDVEKQYTELLGKKETLAREKDEVTAMMNEIESKKKDLFMNTFNTLNDNFKSTFTQLSTKGSEAYLMLENPDNPFQAGVRVRVRIAGDKFMDIRSLSGGEKTMTALAFIFSIQEYEPASFYIFDEVDASLDKKNSEKFAQLIKKYSEKAQYIVISHNDNVIAEASTLYGVSMDEHGMSNVVSLKV